MAKRRWAATTRRVSSAAAIPVALRTQGGRLDAFWSWPRRVQNQLNPVYGGRRRLIYGPASYVPGGLT